MRTFVHGRGADRKIVRIETRGRRMTVITGKPDGTAKRNDKDLASEAEVAAACERMVRELLARGFVEMASKSDPARPAPRPAEAVPAAGAALLAALDDEPEPAAPALPRLGPAPAAGGAAAAAVGEKPSRSKKKKKKRKKAKEGERTDWLAIGGAAAAGVLLLGAIGYLFSGFFQSPTLVGTWQGSQVNHEIGKSLTYDHYRMSFNDRGRVLLIRQQEFGQSGTYRVEGDLLRLSLTDDDGVSENIAYKFSLGHTTLQLFQEDGTPLVKLIRMNETDAVPEAGAEQPAAEGAGGQEAGPIELAANPALATAEHVAKDLSFACMYPAGWESKGGSRPDNTYAWAEFAKGSAQVRIDADVTGSLVADIQNPTGAAPDEFAEPPVATAHATNKKKVAEGYSDYQEGGARAFTQPNLGEGRVAEFTATGSGLFGSKLRGYRATLLTNNRRITVLCQAPESDWATFQPTFQAVIQSLRR